MLHHFWETSADLIWVEYFIDGETEPSIAFEYGNFDIILDLFSRFSQLRVTLIGVSCCYFSRISQLRVTLHVPCATLYLVPMRIVC